MGKKYKKYFADTSRVLPVFGAAWHGHHPRSLLSSHHQRLKGKSLQQSLYRVHMHSRSRRLVWLI